MRLLIVTFDLPRADARSGSLLFMHGEIEALRARHAVTLVTFSLVQPDERRALAALRASGLQVHVIGEHLPAALIRGKRAMQRWIGDMRGWPALGNPRVLDPRLPRALAQLTAAHRFDVLQVEDIGLGAFAFESPIPTVLVEHEVLEPTGGDLRDGLDYQPALWRRFDRVQVFSQRDADLIARRAPDVASRVRVNPFGVDIPARTATDIVERAVTFVGAFKHPPNVDAAIWLGTEIMPILRRSSPGVTLSLVGDGPPASVRSLAADDVIVTGAVPSVEPYLDRASVVVAPVRMGGGMRVKVLQALARGKAVVTTSLGAEGLAAAPAGPPLGVSDSTEDFAAAVARLLANPEAAAVLGRRARSFVEAHHGWARYRERLEATYAELVPAHDESHARA
jgi:glycosyltransferase involved in cell wall biosynthesis